METLLDKIEEASEANPALFLRTPMDFIIIFHGIIYGDISLRAPIPVFLDGYNAGGLWTRFSWYGAIAERFF